MSSSAASEPLVPPPERIASTERELVVVVRSDMGLRVSPTGLTAVKPAALDAFQNVLRGPQALLRPLFGADEERLRFESMSPPSASYETNVDLSRYYKIEARDDRLEEIADQLRKLDEVSGAYIKPPASLPALNNMLPMAVTPPQQTPDFANHQVYLNGAPAGVDARFAWTLPGGKGKDVRIIDIEGEWRYSHEDLRHNKGGVVGGSPPNDLGWRNHGTAVIGIFGADDNTFGVWGICAEAEVSSISVFPKVGAAEAIRLAAMRLRPGDIILVELHRAGPRRAFIDSGNQLGCIPVEWWPDEYDVIRYATSRGIIVVEAGGNGGENLDDKLYDSPQEGFPDTWANPFGRGNRDSGAIIVGAGAPPPGSNGQNHGPDCSRLEFSNYGSVIDAQGWGRAVTTCGFGDLQGGLNEDLWYTDNFSGTSSAAPIIVGVIGCLQGMLRSRNKPPLTPLEARQLLRSTGSHQADAPGRPKSQRIGNRPDLRQLISKLSAVAAPAARPGTGGIRAATSAVGTRRKRRRK